MPRAASASRSRHSTWALTLRSSARRAALDRRPQGRIGAQRIGLAVIVGHGGPLLVERAGVDDGLRVALAAQDDHQVRDHRRAALVVELDDVLLRQHVERHLDHADRAFDQRLARGDDGLRLLAAKHRAGDFLCIGEVGEAAFVDGDAGDREAGLKFGAEARHRPGRGCRAA